MKLVTDEFFIQIELHIKTIQTRPTYYHFSNLTTNIL